jgi:hypothetical protein
MELTTGQQRLLFVAVVLALAGLGIYLIGGRNSGGAPAAAPTVSASTSSAPSPPAPSASATGAASTDVPPASVPAATPASTVGGAEIYQWLPFTPADLAAAAKTTVAFAAEYATWSYTEDGAAYAAKLSGLVTAPEVATLKYDYGTSGVAGRRVQYKQVSTASGSIDSISSFSPGPSITFLVTITQKVTSTQPASTQANKYTVTVGSSGGSWQVSDIELSGLGNQGLGNE